MGRAVSARGRNTSFGVEPQGLLGQEIGEPSGMQGFVGKRGGARIVQT